MRWSDRPRLKGLIGPLRLAIALAVVGVIVGYLAAGTGGAVEVPTAPASLTPARAPQSNSGLEFSTMSPPSHLAPAPKPKSKTNDTQQNTTTPTTPTRPKVTPSFDSIG